MPKARRMQAGTLLHSGTCLAVVGGLIVGESIVGGLTYRVRPSADGKNILRTTIS